PAGPCRCRARLGVGRRARVEAARAAGGAALLGLVGGVAQNEYAATPRYAHRADHLRGDVGLRRKNGRRAAAPGGCLPLLAVFFGVIGAHARDARAGPGRDQQAADEDVGAFGRGLLLFARAVVLALLGVAAAVGVLRAPPHGGVGGLVEDEQPVALLAQAGIQDGVGEALQGAPVFRPPLAGEEADELGAVARV